MASYTSPSSFSTPRTATQATNVTASALPTDLPPSALDILPVLSSILIRLQPTLPTGTSLNPSASPNPQTQLQSHSNALAHAHTHAHPSAHSQSQSQHSQTTQGTQFQPQSQSQQPGSTAPSSSSGHPPSQSHNHSNTFATTPLAPKDIPAATDTLKHRLQKARTLVAALPDMGRGVGEQEEEIAMLEERIKSQKDILERLRALGASKEGIVEG